MSEEVFYEFDQFTPPQTQNSEEPGDKLPKDHKVVNLTLGVTLLVVFLLCLGAYYLLNRVPTSGVEGTTTTQQVGKSQGVSSKEETQIKDKGVNSYSPETKEKVVIEGEKQGNEAGNTENVLLSNGLNTLQEVPELGNVVELKARVVEKSVATFDNNILLYRIDFEILENGKGTGKTLYTFLTKSSWDLLTTDSNLNVQLRIDKESRFSLERVVIP